MKRLLSGLTAVVTAVALIVTGVPAYAADFLEDVDSTAFEGEIIPEDTDAYSSDHVGTGSAEEIFEEISNDNESAESDIVSYDAASWPTPSANWYEQFEYELDDTNSKIWLNRSKGNLSGNVVIPGKATISGNEYKVGLKPAQYNGLWTESDREKVTGIKFEGGVKAPESCAGLFANFENATYFDLSGLDTSGVKEMSEMFRWCKNMTGVDLTGVDTSQTTNMLNMFAYCGSLSALDVTGFDTSKVTDMSGMFQSCDSLKTLDVTHFDTSKVTSMSDMFRNCDQLASLDVSGFDTSNVISMFGMFLSCESLTVIDVSGFNTSQVSNMSWMFASCDSVKTLDVSHFNTSKVTDMSIMFSGCSELETLDVSGFDTSKVKSLSSMFSGCEKLKVIDVSGFDTHNVEYYGLSNMFDQCESVTELDVSNFDTGNVASFERMFSGCINLKELDLRSFNTTKAENMQNMFAGMSSLKTLDVRTFDFSLINEKTAENTYGINYAGNFIGKFRSGSQYPKPENGVEDLWLPVNAMSGYNFVEDPDYEPNSALKTIHYAGTKAQWDALNNTVPATVTMEYEVGEPDPPMTADWYKEYNYTLTESPKEIRIHSSKGTLTSGQIVIPATAWYDGDTYRVVIEPDTNTVTDPYQTGYGNNTSLWGADKEKITSVKFKSGVKAGENLSFLFADLNNLAYADLSGLDTSETTDMTMMFKFCYKLSRADMKGIDTSKVTSMRGLFYQNIAILDPDISGFDTSSVTDMSCMFDLCYKPEIIDISNFDTSKVKNMYRMFGGCSSLNTIVFGDKFNTSKVQNMSEMFDHDEKLKDLDMTRFNVSGTGELKNMENMFRYCLSLTSLDLSGFDTSGVYTMHELFSNCYGLKEIRFGDNFKTYNVRDMYGMFANCTNLRSIDVTGFDTTKVENMIMMFGGCSRLNEIDVSSFKTSKATAINCMFERCPNLRTLDVRSFDFEDVRELMRFTQNSGVTHLYLPHYAMKNYDFTDGYDEGAFKIQKIYYAGTEEEWLSKKNTVPAGVEVIFDYGKDEDGKWKPVEELTKVVEDIVISSETLEVKKNKPVKLTLTITPENAADKTIRWESESPTLVSVDQNGNVTGLAEGAWVTIRATAADRGTVWAECEVRVSTDSGSDDPEPVKPEPDKPEPDKPEPAPLVPSTGSGYATDPLPVVTEDTTALTLVKGQKFTLSNTDWTSDNTKIISVSKGNVIAKAATGDSPVKLKRGNSQSIDVTVLAPVIDKKDKTLKLVVGSSAKLNLKNTGDLSVWYSSAAPDVAAVDSKGTVTAISKGSAVITAYVNGVAYKFTVKAADADTSKRNFTLEDGVSLVPNQTIVIKATGFTASKATWTSKTKVDTDENNIVYRDNVVKIDKSGKMTAIGVGSTSFTGTDSKSNTVNIRVNVSAPAEHVLHLNVNSAKSLKLYGVKGSLNWCEDTEGGAGVPESLMASTGNGSGIMEFGDKVVKYQSGKFTGLKSGAVTLKANDGNFDHILKIYVEDPSVNGLDGNAYNYSVRMKAGENKTFTLPGVMQDVTFISNKTSVAFASPADTDGNLAYVISARGSGSAKISAKINGKAVTINVKVTK